ncbi:BTB/POZ domain-containing protein 6-like isoform X2 [Amblyomma americanum]
MPQERLLLHLRRLSSEMPPTEDSGRSVVPAYVPPSFRFVPSVPFRFSAPPAESATPPKPPAMPQLINLEKYLDSTVFSDVEFVVQSEKYSVSRSIRAHKQFLAMRNEVFGTMFFGSLPEKDKVHITDLHPRGFYGLLKYIYCGACLPDSFEEAIYIREAADKYLVPELVTVCSKYIAENLTPDRVCPLIDCLATTDTERIDDAALRVLRSNAAAVLNSESFVDSHDTTVEAVLSVVCGVPESCVFTAIRRWAEERCRRSLSTGETPVDVDAILRPFLPKLRFLALTPQEYVKGPGSWNLLKSNEDYAILRNIIVRGSVPLPSWVCTNDTSRSQFRELFASKPFPTTGSLSKETGTTGQASEVFGDKKQ